MKKYSIYSFVLFSLLALLNVLATFPGYLYADTKFILSNIKLHWYNDWHSPFYTLLLKLLTKILPGPEMINIVNIIMMWGCLWALSVLVYKKIGFRALSFVLVPFFPGVLNLSGTPVIDQTLCGLLMLATVLIMAASSCTSVKLKTFVFCAAILICDFAFLTRINAIFSVLVMVGCAISVSIKRRKAFVFLACLACMFGSSAVINKVLHVQKMHMERSVQFKHLGQLSYYEQKNVFPGSWDIEQTNRILHGCYRQEAWDNESPWGYCNFVFYGTRVNELKKAWILNIARHPFDFFVSLLPTYKVALISPLHQTMMFNWFPQGYPSFEIIDWNNQEPYNKTPNLILKKWVNSGYNFYLSRPYIYVILDIFSIIMIFSSRSKFSKQDRVVIGVIMSSLVYMLTFFIANVSTEYRYYIWVQMGADIGFLYTVLTTQFRTSSFNNISIPKWLKIFISSFAALTITAACFNFPIEHRKLKIFPYGKVELTHINIDAPVDGDSFYDSINDEFNELDSKFDGKVIGSSWKKTLNGYESPENGNPFTFITSANFMDIAVGYKTGLEYGSFKICYDDNCRIIFCHDNDKKGDANTVASSKGIYIDYKFTFFWVFIFLFVFFTKLYHFN